MPTAWWNWQKKSGPCVDSKVRDDLVVTLNYWAFTLTDGAMRMLVVLHVHSLG